MFSLIRERRTTAHACLTLGFKGSGFSLLIIVQLRGFGNSLYRQHWLSQYIVLCSVITLEKGVERAKSIHAATMAIMVLGQVY